MQEFGWPQFDEQGIKSLVRRADLCSKKNRPKSFGGGHAAAILAVLFDRLIVDCLKRGGAAVVTGGLRRTRRMDVSWSYWNLASRRIAPSKSHDGGVLLAGRSERRQRSELLST
jgi:hypothetical protein